MSQDPKSVVRRFVEEFQTQNKIETADELIADDFVNHSSMGLPPNKEGVKQLFAIFRVAFPDLRAEIHEQLVDGEKVTTRKTFYGTHKGDFMEIPPTGKPVSIGVIDIVRVVDGKMKEHWNQVDQFGLMQQLGVVPTPG